MKGRRDDIQLYFEYDIHVGARRIYLGRPSRVQDGECDTDNTLASQLTKSLHILTDLSSTEPIYIDLNNSGGEVSHGMAIWDSIHYCPCHVSITVLGQASSMGSVILQAADTRILTPHSYLLIHYGEASIHTNSISLKNHAAHEEIINTRIENIYLDKIREKKPKFTRKQLSDMLKEDTILTAEEALALGLCDQVIG